MKLYGKLGCYFLSALVLWLVCACSEQPRVGETWKWEYKSPFEENSKTYKVLAVEDGYIQYKNIDTGRIDSSSVAWFKVGSRLIEDEAN